mmetsp:Transcript_25772/g.41661  ORF Transcript_25772/g.41661 Transcript_25772/m.41661 type:complete len:132 (+) Transcript_25772:2596-2991(+)
MNRKLQIGSYFSKPPIRARWECKTKLVQILLQQQLINDDQSAKLPIPLDCTYHIFRSTMHPAYHMCGFQANVGMNSCLEQVCLKSIIRQCQRCTSPRDTRTKPIARLHVLKALIQFMYSIPSVLTARVFVS